MSRIEEIHAFDDAIHGLAKDYACDRIANLDVDSETEIDLVAYRVATTLFSTPEATNRAIVRAVFGVLRYGTKNYASALVYLALRADHHLRHMSGDKMTLGVAVIGPDPEKPS